MLKLTMLKLQPATQADLKIIKKILEELDLSYLSITYDNFFVTKKNHKITGVVKFEEKNDYFYVSSFGVAPQHQKQGIASRMLKALFKMAAQKKKNIYLHTLIPKFFEKAGFKIIPSPAHVPRLRAACVECTPNQCVCMVKLPNAS